VWINFAETGNPSQPGLEWKPYTKEEPEATRRPGAAARRAGAKPGIPGSQRRYSARNAVVGSTRDARIAGIQLASSVTDASAVIASARVAGSPAWSP
jgi:hypothetical protein